MIFNILSSCSTGNAVIYHDSIMVDCGLTYKKIKPYAKHLKLVLLTHIHQDHFKKVTIQKLAHERPTLKFACCDFLISELKQLGVTNIIRLEVGKTYQMGDIIFSPIKLYHNVENVGYRIFKGNHKILHATDTCTLEGISAKGYDLYMVEFNFDEDTIQQVIDEKVARGEFAYEIDAMQNHLSFQKAEAFINANKKDTSEIVKLHVSSRYKEDKANE